MPRFKTNSERLPIVETVPPRGLNGYRVVCLSALALIVTEDFKTMRYLQASFLYGQRAVFTQTKFLLSAFMASLVCNAHVSAAPTDQHHTFTGSGSCASSVCHGSLTPQEGTILKNEYVTWTKHDAHATAWRSLVSPEGKRIGFQLGIKAPEEDKLCLSCHATYRISDGATVPGDQITEGVGCESCHGAASGYLKSHVASDATHERNIAHGMTDLTDLSVRANRCLSCHFGEGESVVTHRIMGAGHPRLSFELESYTEAEPPHWKIDQDYQQRKGAPSAGVAWLVGQYERALRQVALVLSSTGTPAGHLPEFTQFSCYSCHHSLDVQEYLQKNYQGRPGALRINIASATVLAAALEAMNVSEGTTLSLLVKAFEETPQADIGAQLAGRIESLRVRIASSKFTTQGKEQQIARRLGALAAPDQYLTYEVAEQIAMGLRALTVHNPRFEHAYARIEQVYQELSRAGVVQQGDFQTKVGDVVALIR